MPRDMQKATAINRRQSAASLISKRIRCWVTEGRKSKDSLNEGHIFILNWIKIGSLGSAIFKIGHLAETRNTMRRQKIWLSLILHKIHVYIQITSLEHPGLLSILLTE